MNNSLKNIIKFPVQPIRAVLSICLLSLFIAAPAHAHRGAKGQSDACRIAVGTEVVHFSAYTPTFTKGESYCEAIPNLGLTHIVIDYEGKKLRDSTVEFEITKEPEGTRVFYQKPEKIKKGSMDAKVDFTNFGAGEYLTHVTIVDQGEKLDSHLPFSVGIEIEEDNIPYKLIIPIILVIISLIGVNIVVNKKEKAKLANATDEAP
ncbi:MAG: hypothetical protein RQ733_03825 [Methyloprofundus sp.]|nr:hypothetical protein [Methyloprofundus sp.]MDT8425083.1 hypothetical protein [Methyloprofundus sp.]